MNCARFEEMLEALLDERLADNQRQQMAMHASGCARCRELKELTTGTVGLSEAEPAPDLTDAIVARTAGDVCSRAEPLLLERLDGRLASPLDGELLENHLAHCAGCASLERSLAVLHDLLPRLARLEPGDVFTSAVMERTAAAAKPPWGRRVADAWWRLAQRPRFAWESAYVVTAFVTVALALQGSLLQASPETFRSLTAATRPARDASGRTLWNQRFDALGKNAWQVTGGEGMEQMAEARGEIEERYRRTSDARGALKEHGNELAEAVTELDVKRGTSAIVQVGEELGTIVQHLIGQEREDDGTANHNSLGSNETP